jgi:hypothetical protein
MRGTMLWFNEAKDLGALRTDDGVRIELSGTAFLPGEMPIGPCAGRVVGFESLEGTSPPSRSFRSWHDAPGFARGEVDAGSRGQELRGADLALTISKGSRSPNSSVARHG